MNTIHAPVMTDGVLEYLDVRPGGVYVDATLGGGGHAEAILEKSAPNGRVIGLDADATMLAMAQERLESHGDRLTAHNVFFDAIGAVIDDASLDGALFDLGVSSWHFEQSGRGFSFQNEEPLDMRLSDQSEQTAAHIINHVDQQELEHIIRTYGEERYAGRIARAIVEQRPIQSSKHLADIVVAAVPTRGRIHPATRTFQALRIAVNDELGRLERALPQALEALQSGGRCVVIAFHSLEDRIVKQQFRRWDREEYGNILTKKPVRPTDKEQKENPRSRSARLRAFQKK